MGHHLCGVTGKPSRRSVVKGLIFGALAWLAMMIIFTPLVGHGLIALSLGPQATVVTLVLHLIYGAVLGGVYGLLATKQSWAASYFPLSGASRTAFQGFEPWRLFGWDVPSP
jgi:hypothetical protein